MWSNRGERRLIRDDVSVYDFIPIPSDKMFYIKKEEVKKQGDRTDVKWSIRQKVCSVKMFVVRRQKDGR